MKNLTKRGLSLLLVLVMCLGMLNITAFAAENSHTHNESGWNCTQAEGTKELTCDLHVHGDSCYETKQGGLTCEVGEHTHGDGCYDEEGNLACEAEEHTHGSDCYAADETVMVCAEEDHQHTDECYTVTEGAWTCVAPKTEAPKTPAATVDDFMAACAAMGDADDEASILAVLDGIEAVYTNLSDADKAAVAEQWAYVQRYRESISAGNPDDGVETLASGYTPVTNVGIYPDKKPAGSTATGKVRQSGQSLTMKVGQKASFLLGAPTNTLVGGSCGHTLAVYNPSDYCDISLVDNSGLNLVGNPTYAAGNNNGARVFDTRFDALKPGASSDVRVCYYANFGIVFTNGANSAYVACPRCGRSCVVYKDVTWYRYNDVFGITVNADYKLNYDAQGGSAVAPTTRTVANTAASLTVTSTVPTKDGYKFMGWAETENGTVKYKAGGSVTLNWSEGYGSASNPVSKTLYAVWEEDDGSNDTTYRIDREYWINGEKVATATGATSKGTVGDVLVGADLDAENTGWRTRKYDGKERTFDYAGSDPETLTLTADGSNVITLKYEINDVVEKTYTVIYKDGANGAAFGDESHGNLKEGDATPAFEGSTARTDYIFQGWAPAIKDTVDPDMANEDGEIIYTATWLKNERKITVTWKDGYTDNPIKVEKVKQGTTYEELEPLYPDDPERDGYEFNGWGEPETDEDGNITITAKWKKVTTPDPEPDPETETMIVQWVKGYGSATSATIKAITIAVDADYADEYPADPERDGYRFTGWSDPVESTAGDGQKVITITAQWEEVKPDPEPEKVTITINFVDENGNVVKTETVSVDKGSEYDKTEEVKAIPEGYVANGDPTGDPVTGTADSNKVITVPVRVPGGGGGGTRPTPTPDPTPDPEPDENIPDPDVPQIDIPDEEPPLANLPEEPVIDVPDEDVPLADVPETGDKAGMWSAMAMLSAFGLAVLSLFDRKKRKEG